MLKSRKRILGLMLSVLTVSSVLPTSTVAFASTVSECQSAFSKLDMQVSPYQDISVVKEDIESLPTGAEKTDLQAQFNNFLENSAKLHVITLTVDNYSTKIVDTINIVTMLPESSLKTDLTEKVTEVTAEYEVLGLENGTGTLPSSEIEAVINSLANTTKKLDLLARLKAVPVDQNIESVKQVVHNLSIKSTTIGFDEAKAGINRLADGVLKQNLQAKYDSIKSRFNDLMQVVTNLVFDIESKDSPTVADIVSITDYINNSGINLAYTNLQSRVNTLSENTLSDAISNLDVTKDITVAGEEISSALGGIEDIDTKLALTDQLNVKYADYYVTKLEQLKTQESYNTAKSKVILLNDSAKKTALLLRMGEVKIEEVKTIELVYSKNVDDALKSIDLYAHITKFSNELTETSFKEGVSKCVATLPDVKLDITDFKKSNATATTSGQVFFTFSVADNLVTEKRTMGIIYAKLGDTTTANDVVYVDSIPLIGDVDTRPKDDVITGTVIVTTPSAVTVETSHSRHHKTGEDNDEDTSSSTNTNTNTSTDTAQANNYVTADTQALIPVALITEGMIAESKVATSVDLAKVGTVTNGLKLVQTPSGKVVEVATTTKVWVKDGNSWLLYTQGEKTTGWSKVNNQWYLMDSNGIMQTGWTKNNGVWYFLNDSGAMKTGWFLDSDSNWYYLDASGAMKTGWFKDSDGSWYFLNIDGSMASDTTINGYTLGADGRWV